VQPLPTWMRSRTDRSQPHNNEMQLTRPASVRAAAALAADLGVRQTLPVSASTSMSRSVLVLVAALGACQFDPYRSEYAKVKPSAEELVGTWVATADTAKKLASKGLGALQPRIVLEAGGAISISGIPDESEFAQRPLKDARMYRGRWTLFADSQEKWGLVLEPAAPFCYGCLMVMRDSSPRLLVIRYGDPDSGSGYEFERAVEQ
jgi:hypothetical protein